MEYGEGNELNGCKLELIGVQNINALNYIVSTTDKLNTTLSITVFTDTKNFGDELDEALIECRPS